tara:strand:+ start:1365 stop:2798 length:1434 start_codon:yes stop_codon:yes gene_type:complete
MFILNYVKIAIWASIYYFQKEKSDVIMKIIVNNIRDSGCVAIKFSQWILPKLESMYDINTKDEKYKWFKDLEELYEDCNYHDTSHTKRLYYNNFNSELEDDYEIQELIASGSIGQVYKVKELRTNRICAMKVVHPNMKFQLLFFDKFIKSLYLIPMIRKLFNYYMPIELKQFIKDFKEQCNLINEANNCMLFQEEYRSNQLIIIPEVIRISEKILIMSYEDGKRLEDMKFSEYSWSKVLMALKLFIKSNECYFKYFHGDLHKGNWKVRVEDNITKIVIYDFGFCWKVPKFLHNEMSGIDKAFMNVQEDKQDTIDAFSKACWIFIGKKVSEDFLKKQIFKIKKETKLEYEDPVFLLKLIIDTSRNYNVILDSFVVQSVILHIQTTKNFEDYYLTRTRPSGSLESLGDEYYNRRIHDIITFCKTFNAFMPYCSYLESELIEEKIEIKELFGTIDKDNNFDKYDFLKGMAIENNDYSKKD